MMPRLSIIVPVYKVEKYLRKCIDSILEQTFTDFELILVNDGSPDSCPQICEDYKIRDERVVLFNKENGGLSDARNFGLDIARGDYLGFVDSDDYIKPNMYEVLINVIKETGSDMVVCDNYRVSSGGITVQSWGEKAKCYSHEDAMYQFLTDKIGSQAWNKLYKKELFAEIRYPQGRVFEDIPTTYKYVHRCNKISYIKTPLYYYTIRDDNISFSCNSDKIYHIFLGFKERYEFAKIEYPQFVDECLKLVVEHCLLVCYQAVLSGDDIRFEDMHNYLIKQKKDILKSKRLPIKRKTQALLLILNRNLYYVLIKGLQFIRRNRKSAYL
jgi:glycosyltransferase involved in cell wall biosynthesis